MKPRSTAIAGLPLSEFYVSLSLLFPRDGEHTLYRGLGSRCQVLSCLPGPPSCPLPLPRSPTSAQIVMGPRGMVVPQRTRSQRERTASTGQGLSYSSLWGGTGQAQEWWPGPVTSLDHKAHHSGEVGPESRGKAHPQVRVRTKSSDGWAGKK